MAELAAGRPTEPRTATRRLGGCYLDTRWYVIQCEPHRDQLVTRLAANEGIETYAPRIPATRKRNGDKALFPGYVFARLDLTWPGWSRLHYLPGVRRLITQGDAPCPVDDGIVTLIRLRTARIMGQGPKPAPGDRVRIVGGSFADLEGIFCETLSGDQRVAVLLDMMRREVRIELPAGDVERVLRELVA